MTYNLNPDFFELFGLPKAFHQDNALIKTRLYQLQQRIHPDNYINATPHEKRLAIEYAARVNEAYRILECPLKRAVYLLKLQGIDALNEMDTSMPMDFLMEQMSIRERMSLVHHSHSASDLLQLKKEIDAALIECEKRLREYLGHEATDLSEARLWVRKMQFYVRLHEELATMTSATLSKDQD
ncbi:MAG: Fe-S protein assembly co-chaperone HscB [Gammaproteobacteria bacterium 39-13]|nr:Fe-S protein assembly co-chaperone HscB [Gammaproteobacteria bacterium]OJV88854.1 MAG: Fe-S protein assembly co-chaperone HscB [Gammaproteobacteria bacterium 39-13]